ncbi:MAG: DUF1203 domain-containing protein [Caldimonas sp.]
MEPCALFVRGGAEARSEDANVVPAALQPRPLSLRAFDSEAMIVNAELVDGREMRAAVARPFADPRSLHIHVHFARYGCFAARVDRGELVTG